MALRVTGMDAIACAGVRFGTALGTYLVTLDGASAAHAAHPHAAPHPHAAVSAFGMDHATGEAGGKQNQGKNFKQFQHDAPL